MKIVVYCVLNKFLIHSVLKPQVRGRIFCRYEARVKGDGEKNNFWVTSEFSSD